MGPVLCAGLTAYKAVLKSNIKAGDWLVVVGAGGGLGHLAGRATFPSVDQTHRNSTPSYMMLITAAVQYARACGARVIGIDGGSEKGTFVKSIGAREYIDFRKTIDLVHDVYSITGDGAHAVIVTAGNPKAYSQAAEMLRVGGTLSCVGVKLYCITD